MADRSRNNQESGDQIEGLRARLAEAEETLQAIRSGEVDALVVAGPEGNQIYTLKGAESTYRMLVEAMNEGALVLTHDGTVMYSNSAFAQMIDLPLEQVIGSRIHRFVRQQDLKAVDALLEEGKRSNTKRELALRNESTGELVPTQMSVGKLPTEAAGISDVVTDLTEHKRTEAELETYREHLEELVEERTTQLQAATEELGASNEELRVTAEGLAAANSELLREVEERKRVEDELISDKEYISALEGVAELGVSKLEMGELMNLLAERIAEGLKVRSCHIMTLDEDSEEFVTQAVYNVPEQTGFRIGSTDGFIGKIYIERRTIYLSDVENDPLAMNANLRRHGVKSLLGTPLVVRDRVIGVIYVDIMEAEAFGPEDVRLLEDMASRAALIINNTMLQDEVLQSRHEVEQTLEQELHFSHMLQRALLPTVPAAIDGLTLASIYIPAFASRELGGDFYDVFQTEDGKIVLLIGDVSGKGLEAASFAAASRNTIHAFAFESSSPGESLTHANAVLSAAQEAFGLFVTVFLVIIDTKSGGILYASGGHPPAAVYHADGSVNFLSFGDPPLGMLSDFRFKEGMAHLGQGEKVALYTDGITEARHEAEMFETTGIERVLREHGHLSPVDLLNELVTAATAWADGHLSDDTAVLVVQRT